MKFFNEAITVAIMLTLSRILLAGAAAFFIAEHQFFIAAFFCYGAAFTDFADGYMARKLQQTTQLGAVLDPLADKIFLGTIAVSWYVFVDQTLFPAWFIMAFVVKEVVLLAGAAWLLCVQKSTILQPSWISKCLTACMMVHMVVLLMMPQTCLTWPYYPALLYGYTAGMLLVMIDYARQLYKKI